MLNLVRLAAHPPAESMIQRLFKHREQRNFWLAGPFLPFCGPRGLSVNLLVSIAPSLTQSGLGPSSVDASEIESARACERVFDNFFGVTMV